MAARYVFIWHDSHRSSLQAPYDWPFRILEAGPKNFVVDKGGNRELVLIDRLKPAHIVSEELVELAQPPCCGLPPKAVPFPGPPVVHPAVPPVRPGQLRGRPPAPTPTPSTSTFPVVVKCSHFGRVIGPLRRD